MSWHLIPPLEIEAIRVMNELKRKPGCAARVAQRLRSWRRRIGKRMTRTMRMHAALYHLNRSLPPPSDPEAFRRWDRHAGRLEALMEKWGYGKKKNE